MAKDVFAQALELPVNERARLAHELLVSLDDTEADSGAAEAWDVEIERRVAEFDAGKTKGVPWDTLKQRLERKFAKSNSKKVPAKRRKR